LHWSLVVVTIISSPIAAAALLRGLLLGHGSIFPVESGGKNCASTHHCLLALEKPREICSCWVPLFGVSSWSEVEVVDDVIFNFGYFFSFLLL